LTAFFGNAEKCVAKKMLLDPCEEELYLPSHAADIGKSKHRQCEIVGQENQRSPAIGSWPI
jgi:hypothetical protein